MDDPRIGYKSYWVGYFDLLGFKNRVNNMPDVWPIREGYQTLLAEIRKNSKEICSTWFSDTFLFYTPDDSAQSFAEIAAACELLFYRMIRSHMPARGCLAVGDFYAEDDVLVGPALIDAYELAQCQDWLGFVLSPDVVTRRKQYDFPSDCYREYDVPVDHSKSTKRLETYIVGPSFPPHQLWKCVDDMENGALDMIEAKRGRGEEGQPVEVSIEEEKECVLRKYRNTKKYLKSLHPWLADCVRGEYGPILLNEPEVKRKIRERSWGLK